MTPVETITRKSPDQLSFPYATITHEQNLEALLIITVKD
jgi:hypothetical protein